MLKFGFSSLILVNPAAPKPRRGRVVVGTRPQKGPAQFRVHQEFVAVALAHDPAVGQKIRRPGGGEGPGGVLLHQQDGNPAPAELLDNVEDFVGDQRRQPQGRLIQEQKPGLGHQGPAHGHHLLLPAGEGVGPLAGPLPEFGEPGIDRGQAPGQLRPAYPQGQGPQLQVLLDRQVPEHLPALGAQGHAFGRHGRGGRAGDLEAVQEDAAARRRRQPHDGLEQAGLAGAVGPHQGHGLAGRHRQVDAEQGLGGAVVHRQVVDAE